MNERTSGEHRYSYDRVRRIAKSAFDKILSLPGVLVDRESFLTKELRVYCPDEQVKTAIELNPAAAQIPSDLIERIAESVIRYHVRLAAVTSFGAGIPGGLVMAITIPTDQAQVVRHAMVLAQKLAYLYGWPDLQANGEPDEETKNLVILMVGSMWGVKEANIALDLLAKEFAQQFVTRVPRQPLTKTLYYPALKEILKWFGIKLTKQTFAGGIAKFFPVASGITSAALTRVVLRRGARQLQDHVRELRFAKPQGPERRIEGDI